MRRWLVMGLCVFFLTVVSGCYRLVPKSYFEFLSEFDSTVIEDYKQCVQNDSTLDDFQKRNRLELIKTFRINLEEYVDVESDQEQGTTVDESEDGVDAKPALSPSKVETIENDDAAVRVRFGDSAIRCAHESRQSCPLCWRATNSHSPSERPQSFSGNRRRQSDLPTRSALRATELDRCRDAASRFSQFALTVGSRRSCRLDC